MKHLLVFFTFILFLLVPFSSFAQPMPPHPGPHPGQAPQMRPDPRPAPMPAPRPAPNRTYYRDGRVCYHILLPIPHIYCEEAYTPLNRPKPLPPRQPRMVPPPRGHQPPHHIVK